MPTDLETILTAVPLRSVWARPSVTTAGRLTSGWHGAASGLTVTPTTSVALASDTLGAPEPPLSLTGASRLIGFRPYGGGSVSAAGSVYIVIDRLVHSGGLSGTVIGAQTTNLPSAGLTRYTDGIGVCVGIEAFSAIGSTTATFTISYTDALLGSGQTSIPSSISANNVSAGGLLQVILPAGARPISVESFTLAGTTGTAGNIGIVLYKPLTVLHTTLTGQEQNVIWLSSGYAPLISAGAHLQPLMSSTLSPSRWGGEFLLVPA